MVGLQSVGTIKLIFIEQSRTRRMEARSDRQTAATMTFCQPMPLLKLITSADCGLEIGARPVESRRSAVASVGRSAAGEGGHAPLKQLRGFKSSCRPWLLIPDTNSALSLGDAWARNHHYCLRGALGYRARASRVRATTYRSIAGGECALIA
jgi:hypothetical protein